MPFVTEGLRERPGAGREAETAQGPEAEQYILSGRRGGKRESRGAEVQRDPGPILRRALLPRLSLPRMIAIPLEPVSPSFSCFPVLVIPKCVCSPPPHFRKGGTLLASSPYCHSTSDLFNAECRVARPPPQLPTRWLRWRRMSRCLWTPERRNKSR